MRAQPVLHQPGGAAVTVPHERRDDDRLAFVARHLHDLRVDTLRTVSVPVPAGPAERLLAALDDPCALLWEPAEDAAVSGVGVARRIELAGTRRFDTLRTAAARLWPAIESVVHPACAPLAEVLDRPRLFGGLSFAVGAASAAPWDAFGDGSFVLPRWRYTRTTAGAALSLTVAGDDLVSGSGPWLEALESLLDRLSVAHDPGLDAAAARRPAAALAVDRPSPDVWSAQVEAIRAAIGDGRFEKIVAAHRFDVELAAGIDPLAVVGHLAGGLRASTRFLFRRGDAAFLGATPERLVARHGRRIETEALAGSIARGAAHAEQLLASGKDRREHQLVVEPIVRRLQPLCDALEVVGAPRIRTLRDVLHLHTPITGHLKSVEEGGPRDVLALVELLHPTPAVGGVPTEESLRWIAEHEAVGRGWYAGPIGWFDAVGDGEFAVALRAAVVQGTRAHLYAGAGIVADSDPHLEYLETELKARSLLDALGVDS